MDYSVDKLYFRDRWLSDSIFLPYFDVSRIHVSTFRSHPFLHHKFSFVHGASYQLRTCAIYLDRGKHL